MVRKGSRSRRNKRTCVRRYSGGAMPHMVPAGVNDNPMMSPSSASLAQGAEYDKIHMGQHGGAHTPMSGAPVGDTGVLDSSLRAIARIGPTDASFTAIQGMSDQSGGRRRSKKTSRRSKKASRRSKKVSRRRMRGGFTNVRPANASAPGTLLPPSMESRAVGGMNPEWKLAADPTSFAPNLAK
jgi:hypothetical protein